MSAAIRRVVQAINENVVQRDPITVDEMLRDRSYARPRFSVLLMGVFATIGLVLVGSGVYGVMSYSVSRQTREIGIRMALGADRGQVFRSVVGSALRMMGFGATLGAVASLATNRVISSQVWTVTVFDPIALAGGAIVIAVLGGVACFVPAFRATRVRPLLALREE
jgi:putative ABC transport system permease protein